MDSDIFKRLRAINALALGRPSALINSYELAKLCIDFNIEGDFIETGVFAGAKCAAMAIANQNAGMLRRIHLFDSFAGLPEPTIMDGVQSKALWSKEKPGAACPLYLVKRYMKMWGIDENQLVYHVGWFKDTVPVAVETGVVRKIAILRLDGDYYESTMLPLRYLFPLISKNGYLIIDDYGTVQGCKIAVDEYWSENNLPLNKFQIIPDSSGVVYYRNEY